MVEKHIYYLRGKKTCIVKELFQIMSKCASWVKNGRCRDAYGTVCMLYADCAIVKDHDKAMVKCLNKGESTTYLPGVKSFSSLKKSEIFTG